MFKKDRAFTLIEVVFVVVVIGILSAVMAPRVKRATIQEAADQIVSHIRYTQQLALNDNKFNPNDPTWYKTRWQIGFFKTAGTDNSWAYTIFSDINKDGNPNSLEIAKNPLNPKQYLTGGYSGTFPYLLSGKVNPSIVKNMNIGHKYSIKNISFSGGCPVGRSRRIYFDYLGRPMYGPPHSLTKKYFAKSSNKLVVQDCIITITNSVGKSKNIVITPETGYVHIQ
jgi:prepilin-type N-terminal cleavage/methylation domain-containing protein